jgi:hypothetical protein
MAAAAFKCLRNASGGWRWQSGVTWKMLQMHSSRWRYCEVENDASGVRLGRRRSADIGLARHGVVMVGAKVFSFFCLSLPLFPAANCISSTALLFYRALRSLQKSSSLARLAPHAGIRLKRNCRIECTDVSLAAIPRGFASGRVVLNRALYGLPYRPSGRKSGRDSA